MISFFRKIRQKLLTQNKVSRYFVYALGEILLVVVGILLALQINNWNEERKNRIVEQGVLQNLKTELLIIEKDLQKAHKMHTASHQNGLALLRLFGKNISDIPIDQLDSMVAIFENGWTFESRDGYIKSIISSGKLDLIQNEQLKSMLSGYDGTVVDATQETIPIVKLLHDRFWPLIDGKLNSSTRFIKAGFGVIPPGSYQSDFEWFFKNREIEDIISNVESWRIGVLEDEQALAVLIAQMLEIIEREIK